MICNECETVAHCLKNGCVPKQPPASVQEPVGEVCGYYERGFDAEKTRYGKLYDQNLPLGIKLYTTPPNVATPLAAQRPVPEERKSVRSTWVGLTDEERDDLLDIYITAEGRARAIEAKLKAKNSP